MCDFDVGDKVVCVDGEFFPGLVLRLYKQLPVEGSTYVVREVRLGVALGKLATERVRTGEVSVLLVGVVNPPQLGRSKVEPGFAYWRFRKLSDLKSEAAKADGEGKPSEVEETEEVEF